MHCIVSGNAHAKSHSCFSRCVSVYVLPGLLWTRPGCHSPPQGAILALIFFGLRRDLTHLQKMARMKQIDKQIHTLSLSYTWGVQCIDTCCKLRYMCSDAHAEPWLNGLCWNQLSCDRTLISATMCPYYWCIIVSGAVSWARLEKADRAADGHKRRGAWGQKD